MAGYVIIKKKVFFFISRGSYDTETVIVFSANISGIFAHFVPEKYSGKCAAFYPISQQYLVFKGSKELYVAF